MKAARGQHVFPDAREPDDSLDAGRRDDDAWAGARAVAISSRREAWPCVKVQAADDSVREARAGFKTQADEAQAVNNDAAQQPQQNVACEYCLQIADCVRCPRERARLDADASKLDVPLLSCERKASLNRMNACSVSMHIDTCVFVCTPRLWTTMHDNDIAMHTLDLEPARVALFD